MDVAKNPGFKFMKIQRMRKRGRRQPSARLPQRRDCRLWDLLTSVGHEVYRAFVTDMQVLRTFLFFSFLTKMKEDSLLC
jgi:hypothetical protein